VSRRVETTTAGFRPRFFVPAAAPLAAAGAFELVLNVEDSYHASRVLRLRPGDHCEIVFEQSRQVFQAELTAVGSETRARLLQRLEGREAGPVYRMDVRLIQALARPAAVDVVIERGTEVGASQFVLVVAESSPRQVASSVAGRLERWRRIAREAAKQSKQTAVPGVAWAAQVQQAIRERDTPGTHAFVLQPGSSSSLQEAAIGVANSIDIWVGPESGWSADELAQFAHAGLTPVRLGGGILRTETAGPVAVALVRSALGDW
jgi:16S rRNA (uracil1498-N3)-methyltransferase